VTSALAAAAAVTDPAARAAALGRANDQLRADVPLVPLVHPGGITAWRADVQGAAVSPIGADPLGSVVPGDRSQVVMMGAVEPAAGWCGTTQALDAIRLCALVTPGLYAFDKATLDAVPALATGCTPDNDARAWTCRLRPATFADGAQLDAGDVVATFRAIGDAGGPLRAALPADAFAAWDGLFGGPLPASP
jgi:ABC-type transport system substrate-binding protein